MGHSGTGLKSSYSLLKNMSKIPISNLHKRNIFLKFALHSKGPHFSITRFEILIVCNKLLLEMNFGNLY